MNIKPPRVRIGVQATQFSLLDNDATFHHLAFDRTLFTQSQMRAGSVVIPEIGGPRPLQVPGVEKQEMVQALAPNRSDQPLHISVLPGTLWRNEYLLDTQCLKTTADIIAIDSVSRSRIRYGGVVLR